MDGWKKSESEESVAVRRRESEVREKKTKKENSTCS
jgi:hypothetical protein